MVSAGQIFIYVSPSGDDALFGESEANAVASLSRAIRLAESATIETSVAEIFLACGTYKAQAFVTKGHPDGMPIHIASRCQPGGVIFDGAGRGGTWLTLKPRGGNLANIRIQGIEVTNYETAIDLQGDRNNSEIWVGGVEIRNSRFSYIGDFASASAPPSTAAIRLVNADNNVIIGNQFVEIKNRQRCVLLHSIYLAHGSTSNLIEGNTFKNSCGDAIRFRDRSNDNVVRRNRFIDSWAGSPISDWFCNAAVRNDCTKKQGECPSYNNIIDNNDVVSRTSFISPTFIRFGGNPPSECALTKSN